MKRKIFHQFFFYIFVVLVFLTLYSNSYAANITVAGKAKILNTGGYIDFTNYESNVVVDNATGNFSGYAFMEAFGWVAFGTADNSEGPVKVSLTTGTVTGKAKELNTGKFLDFTNYLSNVTVTLSTGVFSGYVWSEDGGWLNFADTGVNAASALVTSTSTTSPSSGSSTSNSTPSAPTCNNTKPSSSPNLYQIDTTSTTAIIYFSPAGNPVNKYYISFGTGSNAEGNGIEFNKNFTTGAVSYAINLLSPNTTYYFKVRGGNGCATGDWSSIKSTKTKGTFIDTGSNFISNLTEKLTGQKDSLDLTITEQKKETDNKETEQGKKRALPSEALAKEGVKVTVKVVDEEEQVVEGAKVTLFSTPKTALTDKNGLAYFTNIERGAHTVKIAYQGYEGEEKLNLSGDTIKEHKVTVAIKKISPPLNPLYLLVPIFIILLILILLLFWIFKRK